MALVVPKRDHLRSHSAHDRERIASTAQERLVDVPHATDGSEPCPLVLQGLVALDAAHGAVASDDHDESIPKLARLAQVVLVAGVQEVERPEREDGPHARTRSSTVKWRVRDLCT